MVSKGISINEKVKVRLDGLKLCRGDSYGAVINRLIVFHEKYHSKLPSELLKDEDGSHHIDRDVDVVSDCENPVLRPVVERGRVIPSEDLGSSGGE